MSRISSLVVFLVIVVGGGLAIGYLTAPGAWYAALAKPSFNPPNWVFAPTWTILYVLIACAGWRAWLRDRHGAAFKVWAAQLILNFAWSPIFFAAHQIALAAVVIVALLATIITFIALRWRTDRTAAGLFMPYAAWVAFATALNIAILRLN